MIPSRMKCIGILFFLVLGGCGGENPSSPVSPDHTPVLTFTEDGYGLQNPTFLYSSANDRMIRIGGELAASIYDGWKSRDIVTIYVDPAMPPRTGTYDFGPGAANPFPGTVVFSNGRRSTWLSVVGGIIRITAAGTREGELLAGDFRLQVEDRNPRLSPVRTYTVSGSFSFVLGFSRPVAEPLPPYPAEGEELYRKKCSGCHALDQYDGQGFPAAATPAADPVNISLKGGFAEEKLVGEDHHGVILDAEQGRSVKIFLNAH